VRKPLGATSATCPLEKRPGAIWVHVVDDRGVDVKDVGASKDGTVKPTDANGVTVFDPVDLGQHVVRLSHRSVSALKLYEEPKKTTRKPTVAAGEITYVPYQLARKPALKVKVVEKGNPGKLFEDATVTVTGPASPPSQKSLATGLADFGLVTAGDYKIKIDLKTDHQNTHATTLDFTKITSDHTLGAGHDKELVIEAEPLNVVTPKIEVEYKLVLLDRKLHDKQGQSETKVYPGATCIRVSATQTNKDRPFTKTGKVDAPNADVFTDAACTKPLVGDLKAEQLIGAEPMPLWLRGKTVGKFDLKLTLAADPENRFVKLAADPAKVEMGVVELKLELHQQDLDKLKAVAMQVDPDTDPEDTYYTNLRNKALPDQKVMTDAEKIGAPTRGDAEKPGRLLHVQKDGHFGRAKLVVAKIDDSHLPAGTDDYDIVLKFGRGASFTAGADAVKPEDLQGGPRDVANSGAIALYDAEAEGNEKQNVSFKVSALKSAAETLWVEGKTETDGPCDLRLDLGLNRAGGGLPNEIKRNGDWARFTVVKIDKVDIVDTRTPGKAEPQTWDPTRKEFYVNFKPEPDGRKIKLAVTLTRRIKNVNVHSMLAPDKDNRTDTNWGINMPNSWKWKDISADVKHKDKADRKDFLHLSAKTDVEGKATQELVLSRFGGDKFQAGAYIDQDPHLAKYYEGDNDLKKRVPVLMTDKIEISRKFWYQLINVAGVPDRDPSGAVARYEAVKTRLEAATAIQVATPPDGAIRKKYQARVNGGNADVLVVTDMNKDQFFATVVKEGDKPIKVPVLIADAFIKSDGNTTAYNNPNLAANDFPLEADLAKIIILPPAQAGNAVVGGKFRVKRQNGSLLLEQDIKDADLSINPTRDDRDKVLISLPGNVSTALAGNANSTVSIVNLVVKGHKSLNGQAFGTQPHRSIVAIYNDESDLTRGHFPNTFAHELAHNLRQVQRPASQATGIPAHPLWYDSPGVGNHCGLNESPVCMMYHTGPNQSALNRFCDTCRLYLLVTDMCPAP
jgi:hypothetical protein